MTVTWTSVTSGNASIGSERNAAMPAATKSTSSITISSGWCSAMETMRRIIGLGASVSSCRSSSTPSLTTRSPADRPRTRREAGRSRSRDRFDTRAGRTPVIRRPARRRSSCRSRRTPPSTGTVSADAGLRQREADRREHPRLQAQRRGWRPGRGPWRFASARRRRVPMCGDLRDEVFVGIRRRRDVGFLADRDVVHVALEHVGLDPDVREVGDGRRAADCRVRRTGRW